MSIWKRRVKTPRFDVQVKARKPRKVITIGRFSTLDDARQCRDGLTTLGFEVMISCRAKDALAAQGTSRGTTDNLTGDSDDA